MLAAQAKRIHTRQNGVSERKDARRMPHAWLRVNTTLNHADLARLVPGIQPATDEEWLQRHHTVLQLKKTVASHHAPLSANQQRSTEQWIRTLDPSHATLVQIGANLHQSTSYANSDPGPQCVALGWRALLLEPAPPIFARLRAKYSNRTRYRRVRTVNAAVCDQCGSEPVPFWHVDTSNATGNWGSLHADARCRQGHRQACEQERDQRRARPPRGDRHLHLRDLIAQRIAPRPVPTALHDATRPVRPVRPATGGPCLRRLLQLARHPRQHALDYRALLLHATGATVGARLTLDHWCAHTLAPQTGLRRIY